MSLKPLGFTILAAKMHFSTIAHWHSMTGSCRRIYEDDVEKQMDFRKLFK